jgi:hypothetical protein
LPVGGSVDRPALTPGRRTSIPDAARKRSLDARHPAGGPTRSQPGGDLDAPLYLIEYVDPQDAGDDSLRGAVANRARRHSRIRPILLLRRLGRAGPEPAALSIWSAPNYASLEPILRDEGMEGMRLVDVGTYRPFGEEVL